MQLFVCLLNYLFKIRALPSRISCSIIWNSWSKVNGKVIENISLGLGWSRSLNLWYKINLLIWEYVLNLPIITQLTLKVILCEIPRLYPSITSFMSLLLLSCRSRHESVYTSVSQKFVLFPYLISDSSIRLLLYYSLSSLFFYQTKMHFV